MKVKDVLPSFVVEDAASDVARLQAAITAIDTQVQQRMAPLLRQKATLQRQLMDAQKRASTDAVTAQKTQQAQAQQAARQASDQAPVSGDSSGQTPGLI